METAKSLHHPWKRNDHATTIYDRYWLIGITWCDTLFVKIGFIGIAIFVGASLVFAGISGFCSMTRILRIMPWNK